MLLLTLPDGFLFVGNFRAPQTAKVLRIPALSKVHFGQDHALGFGGTLGGFPEALVPAGFRRLGAVVRGFAWELLPPPAANVALSRFMLLPVSPPRFAVLSEDVARTPADVRVPRPLPPGRRALGDGLLPALAAAFSSARRARRFPRVSDARDDRTLPALRAPAREACPPPSRSSLLRSRLGLDGSGLLVRREEVWVWLLLTRFQEIPSESTRGFPPEAPSAARRAIVGSQNLDCPIRTWERPFSVKFWMTPFWPSRAPGSSCGHPSSPRGCCRTARSAACHPSAPPPSRASLRGARTLR